MTRDELVADLREAEGGSRILDFWCWWYGMRDAMGSHASPGCSPTSSLDWALRMLPSGLGWYVGRFHAMLPGGGDRIRYTCYIFGTDYLVVHASAPIAVCIAALLARGARG